MCSSLGYSVMHMRKTSARVYTHIIRSSQDQKINTCKPFTTDNMIRSTNKITISGDINIMVILLGSKTFYCLGDLGPCMTAGGGNPL
jgi:hypothetical protein